MGIPVRVALGPGVWSSIPHVRQMHWAQGLLSGLEVVIHEEAIRWTGGAVSVLFLSHHWVNIYIYFHLYFFSFSLFIDFINIINSNYNCYDKLDMKNASIILVLIVYLPESWLASSPEVLFMIHKFYFHYILFSLA